MPAAMKKLLTVLALLLNMASGHAQEAAPALLKEAFAPKWMLKTNLLAYGLLSITLNYEQKVGRKTSVGLLGGYKVPSTIQVAAFGELDGEHQDYAGEVEPQGFFLNPYFRFYTNKTFKGFYVEAFARYYDYTFLVPYDYDKNGRIIPANLDGTATGYGGGLALGVQFELGPRIYLDLHAGMGYGIGNIHLRTNDPQLELEDYRSIARNIEQHEADADVKVLLIGNVLTGIEADANDRSAWADIDGGVYPIVRAGITLGFAF